MKTAVFITKARWYTFYLVTWYPTYSVCTILVVILKYHWFIQYKFQFMKVIIVGPWTTQVLAVWVHLYVDLFQSNSDKKYSTRIKNTAFMACETWVCKGQTFHTPGFKFLCQDFGKDCLRMFLQPDTSRIPLPSGSQHHEVTCLLSS